MTWFHTSPFLDISLIILIFTNVSFTPSTLFQLFHLYFRHFLLCYHSFSLSCFLFSFSHLFFFFLCSPTSFSMLPFSRVLLSRVLFFWNVTLPILFFSFILFLFTLSFLLVPSVRKNYIKTNADHINICLTGFELWPFSLFSFVK